MWARFNQDVWLKAEARTAKIVFTVLTFFIVSWTPFIVIYAINGAGKNNTPRCTAAILKSIQAILQAKQTLVNL
jgi:hypothetical protein